MYTPRPSFAGFLLASLFLLSLGARWTHDLWLHEAHCHTESVCEADFDHSSDKAHFHQRAADETPDCPYAFAGFVKYYDLHRTEALSFAGHRQDFPKQERFWITSLPVGYTGNATPLRGPPSAG